MNPPRPAPPSHRVVREPSNQLRLFAIAYLATLIAGGLLLFAALQLWPGDDSTDGADVDSTEQSAPAPEPDRQDQTVS